MKRRAQSPEVRVGHIERARGRAEKSGQVGVNRAGAVDNSVAFGAGRQIREIARHNAVVIGRVQIEVDRVAGLTVGVVPAKSNE